MLDGLPAHEHSIGHPVEPGLHRVEDALVFPALDPLQLVRRAAGLEGTGEAGGQMTVLVDVAAGVIPANPKAARSSSSMNISITRTPR
jgi:hypothetical protein